MLSNPTVEERNRIESLRELLSIVVTNTKRDMQGKTTQAEREEKRMKAHLTFLLGREPSKAELEAAFTY
jgi:hypothetical protein